MSSLPPIPSKPLETPFITQRVNVSDVVPLRPLSIGETLDLPIKLWRDNFWKVAAPITIVFMPFLMVMYWQGSSTLFTNVFQSAEAIGQLGGTSASITELVLFSAFALFSAVILQPLMQGYLQLLMHKRLVGQDTSFSAVTKEFFRYKALRYTLVYWLVTLAGLAPIIIWAAFIAFQVAAMGGGVGLDNSAVIFIGFMGFLIAMPLTALMAAIFSLVCVVQLVEGAGVIQSFKRGVQLVVKNLARFFGILISIGLVYNLIASGLQYIFSIGYIFIPTEWLWLASALVNYAIMLMVFPMYALIQLVLYRDALIIKEGYDLLAQSPVTLGANA